MARRPKALVVRGKFPYWLLACAILFGLFIILIIVDGGTRLIFYTLSYGIAITVLVSVVSFSLACLLGAIVALAIRSKLTFINQAATFYIEIIRGLPILVLLFYVVFVGAPQLVIAYN